MDYTFTVCGIRHHFADRKLDWSLSPTYNNYCEWPYQFARHSFLRALATYYRETGDERAAKTFVDIVTDFIDRVPPPPEGTSPYKTFSWRTLDTGIRASCWTSVYPTFAKSPAVTEAFREKFLSSLAQHARRLIPDVTRNNWRMAELSGLLRIADAFPQLEGASAWREIAEKGLIEQMRRQVYPDGFQYELSTGYHSFLHHNYAPLARRYLDRGESIPAELRETLCRSYAIYEKLMRPDGRCPALNDAPWPNARGFLRTACELFPERKDFRWIVSCGKEGARPDFLSLALPYAGTVVMRDSWEPDAVWGCVDMSPFGASHQHEDKLSFVMYAYGKDMLTEAGNYDYDTSEMRKYVKSTRSHNTIRIDGKDQNTRKSWAWRPEMLHEKADLAFSTTPERDVAKAAFRLGYGAGKDCDDTVAHVRTVEFLKGDSPRFVITDELTAKDDGEHAYEQLWHLETCTLKLNERDFVADFGDGVSLEATFSSENGVLKDMRATKEPELQGWMPIRPSGPHEHRPIHTPVLKGTFRRATTIRTVFEPRRVR